MQKVCPKRSRTRYTVFRSNPGVNFAIFIIYIITLKKIIQTEIPSMQTTAEDNERCANRVVGWVLYKQCTRYRLQSSLSTPQIRGTRLKAVTKSLVISWVFQKIIPIRLTTSLLIPDYLEWFNQLIFMERKSYS